MTSNFFSTFLQLQYGEIHIKQDEKTGLLAVIAIHSTRLGPALGGCRFLPYSSLDAAIVDALRLAHGMSYKAAISGVAFGGGKAVIIKPSPLTDRKALMLAFAQFVQDLGGRYITAEDSGTSIADMDIIQTVTPFVTGHSTQIFINNEPSPLTALGVRRGIEAAVFHRLKRSDLKGIHVAIQGVGNVGYPLAKELQACGAKLTISDINSEALARCRDEFGAQVVGVDEIHRVTCDVFAPCALGNIIRADNIDEIQAPIIAGSANNQLENTDIAYSLKKKDILYTPDYVINAGGLIHVEAQYHHKSENDARDKVKAIYETLQLIFERAEKEDLPPLIIANRIAEQRLHLNF